MDKREMIAVTKIRLTDTERFDDCFYNFVKLFWKEIVKDKFIDNWHIKYLCNELQEWSKTLINREKKKHDMIINISPGESKSTICSVMFPAWLWTIDPTLRIITVSYNADLSIDLSVKTKDVINSDLYQLIWGNSFKIRDDFDSKALYKNNKGGERIATSVGAKLTGFHGHLKIMDDPNNPHEVGNPDLFQRDSNWYDDVYASRNVEESITLELVVQQRVGINDMTAHLLSKAKKNFKHIKLPATLEYSVLPGSLMKYYKDGLMNPIRRGWDIMETIRDSVGNIVYDAQYGQEPSQSGGGMVSKEDFQILTATEIDPEIWSNPVYYFVDSAFKDKEHNDPTGILVVIPHNNDIYVLDYIDERMNYFKLKERLKEIYFEYSGSQANSLMVVEEASSGYAILNELSIDTPMNLKPYPKSNDSKFGRFNSCVNIMKAGRVKIIDDSFVGKKWNHKYIETLTKFPNVRHDEAVDVTIMAIDELIKNQRVINYYYQRKIAEF